MIEPLHRTTVTFSFITLPAPIIRYADGSHQPDPALRYMIVFRLSRILNIAVLHSLVLH